MRAKRAGSLRKRSAAARRRTAEAAVRVKGRQQRESDPGGGRRRSDTPGELGRVGVRGAVAIVMQVMKLPDVGEPPSSISA